MTTNPARKAAPKGANHLTNEERITQLQQELRSSRIYREVEAREGFVDRIYELMEEKKITRADLARRIGCTRGYVTRILSGDVNFTVETLVKICDAFDEELVLTSKPRAATRMVNDVRLKIIELPAQEVAERKELLESAAEHRSDAAVELKMRFEKYSASIHSKTLSSSRSFKADYGTSDCPDQQSTPLLRYG